LLETLADEGDKNVRGEAPFFFRRSSPAQNRHFHTTLPEGVMAGETIRLTREELYEKVWAHPLTLLAKEFGLSDVGLAKACKRLHIPLPGRGYWAKQKPGQEISRPPLPPIKEGDETELVVLRREILPLDPEQLVVAEQRIALEHLPEHQIHVNDRLTSPHPLVRETLRLLRETQPSEKSVLWPDLAKGCLDVSVSPASLSRAMRIMDALIKALGARGYPVTADPGKQAGTAVVVLGQRLEIALRERLVLKPPHASDKDIGRFEVRARPYFASIHTYDPDGRLQLQIKGWGSGERRTWSDGKYQRLEDCLNDFVVGLIRAALNERAQDLERERSNRQWKEEQRQREEEARRQREEEARRRTLERQVADWYQSRRIRRYVNTAQRTAIQRHGTLEPGSELAQWLSWARQYADQLDPLAGEMAALTNIDVPEYTGSSGEF